VDWTAAIPVEVEHVRPAPVAYAQAYLEMDRAYLGLDVPAYPTELEVALAERPAVKVRVPVRRRPPVYLAPADIEALVRAYFTEADVQQAINVIYCESRFNANAKNPRSSAAGLFQHLAGWYEGRWGVTGVFDPYDPEQSVRAGAALVYGTSSGWSNWDASRRCWTG
jgi:hypothetical protein